MKRKSINLFIGATLALAITAATPLVVSEYTASASVYTEEFVKTYEGKSKLINAPTVLYEINEESDFSVFEGERLPATVIFRVDENLNVVGGEGNICTLDEGFARVAKKSAIAVYVEDPVIAQAYAQYCAQNNARDVFLISSRADVIQTGRAGWNYLLGIFDVRATDWSVEEISATASCADAKIVLADDTLTFAQTRRLKALQFAVWTNVESEADVFEAISDNYTGVYADDIDVVYDAYAKITDETIYDASLIVGHRGSSTIYPENSLEAALYAAEQGAECIEYDVHLTKDKEVIVMHDTTIDGTTNGTGTVSQMTLAEIQQYHLVKGDKTAKIPTLRDMLRGLKDTNVVHYIEYKAQNVEIIPYLERIIKEENMTGRVLFLSFYMDVLAESKRQMPEIPIGQLWGDYDTRDYYGAVDTTISTFLANGKSNHCVHSALYRQYIKIARHRGIAVNGWTFVDDRWKTQFYYGMSSLTIDYPEEVGTLPLRIAAEDKQVTVGESFSGKETIVTGNTTFDGDCSIIVLGDKNPFVWENGEWKANEAGRYNVVYSYQYALEGYNVLSDVITIEVTEKQEEVDDTDNEQNGEENADEEAAKEDRGCASSLTATGVGVTATLLCLARIVKRKRK